MKKIGVLGSISIDNIFEADAVPVKGQRVFGKILGSYFGGIGANQAVEMARYSDQVYMLGCLSTDAAGERFREQFLSRNVNLSRMHRTAVPCGQSFMYLVDEKSDYYSVVTPGANEEMGPAVIEEQIEGLDVLLVSLEINSQAALSALRIAKKLGVFVYLCPSPAERYLPEMLQYADAVILNQREAEIVFGMDPNGDVPSEIQYFPKELKTVVVSCGVDGAVMRHDGDVFVAKSRAVEVLDTVGAGDALTGTVVAMLEQGKVPYRALAYGCIAGSLAVSVVGAQTSQHTEETVSTIFHKEYI